MIGNAVHVMRVATGEVEDETSNSGLDYARKSGLKGGKARANALSPERRAEITKNAITHAS